jgi:transposase
MIDALVAAADLKALDRSALESLVAAQQLQLSAKSEALVAEQEKRINRDSEIEHLKLVITKLQRMIFGTRSRRSLCAMSAKGRAAE